MLQESHHNKRSDSALDSIEHSLYDPKNKMEESEHHHVRGERSVELPTSWGDNSPIITRTEDHHGMSFGVKLLIFSVLLLLCALGFTTYRVMSLKNVVSSANIDMSLDVTPYVEGGETVPLTFTLFNRNTAPLQSASITLSYKQGVGSQNEEEKVHEKRDLGLINQNDYKHQDFSVVLYGSEAEQRDITVKLEYKVAGSNATFSKVVTVSTILKTPPIAVHIDSPKILSVGQNGTFVVVVKNNSATTSLKSILQITLPNTFTTVSNDPRPMSRSTIWVIPPILSGHSATTTIVGYLGGRQGETTSMKALIGSEGDSVNSVGVVYSSQTVDIKLRSSPLNFAMALETDTGSTEKIRYGDRAVITITYANTSDITLQDGVIKLFVSGDAPVLKKLEMTSGYYDLEKQTINWDKSSLPDLATLAPGSSGSIRIVVPITTSGTNSPTLKISLTGSASSEEKDDIVSTISKTWAVQGSATLDGQTTYKNSPFVSTGPIPPMANVETTYTTHLLVSAQNSLVNTRVSFILPSYVSWRNITSDQTKFSFDQRSRTVTWSIGNLGAEKTTTGDIFLTVRPSQSHVGQAPAITSGIVLDADEEISGAHIRTTISPLTTFISGENWVGDPSHVINK